MSKKYKSLWSIFVSQEQEFIFAWILAGGCLLSMLLYNMHIYDIIEELFKNACAIFLKFIHSSSECLYALSVSYIAGWIFYILTVAIPKAKRAKQQLHRIAEVLRYIKDEFYVLIPEAKNVCSMNDDDISELCNNISSMIETNIKDNGHMLLSRCKKLKVFQIYFDSKMVEVFSDISALTEKELEIAIDMKLSNTMSRIRDVDTGEEPFVTHKDVLEIVRGLIELNRQTCELYNSISKRLYKD